MFSNKKPEYIKEKVRSSKRTLPLHCHQGLSRHAITFWEKKKKVFLKKLIFPLKLSFTRQTQSKFGQPTSVHAYPSVYHETRAFCA